MSYGSKRDFTDEELAALVAAIPKDDSYLRMPRPGEARRSFNCFGPLHNGFETNVPMSWDLQKSRNLCPECIRKIADDREKAKEKNRAEFRTIVEEVLKEKGLI